MRISIFDLFSIGVGPSSSHTIGPMKAAKSFANSLLHEGFLSRVSCIKIELYGSLACTGRGHGTDKAILLGLEGESASTINPDYMFDRFEEIISTNNLNIIKQKNIEFIQRQHLIFNNKEQLPIHPNGMCFTAYNDENKQILSNIYYSIGGGFILQDNKNYDAISASVHYPFYSAAELLNHCEQEVVNIDDIILENEKYWHTTEEIEHRVQSIWNVMNESIENGCKVTGVLPGGLNVCRRAANLYQKLSQQTKDGEVFDSINWLNVYAIAVNEENAAGRRIVTAPTNGAAGIIPAVFKYFRKIYKGQDFSILTKYLLTAGAIGLLYKEGASISGAEMGCQGEVGVASSMAAAGFTAILGGTPSQIEHAAEIAIEHHLGLTCDPVGGLVQIPCIERNAMGAVKAVNAARLALAETGVHKVTLDQAIKTMKETGQDMSQKYKETSLGGLAVNVPEC